MSQIPRIVTASAIITKKRSQTNTTHSEQRSRIAEVQSCCGGAGGADAGRSQGPSTQVPQPGFSVFQKGQIPLPPSCCRRQPDAITQSCAVKSRRQPTVNQDSSQWSQLTQPRYTRPPQQKSQLKPPNQGVPTTPNISKNITPPSIRASSTPQPSAPKANKTRSSISKFPFPSRPYGIMNNAPDSFYQPPKPALKPPMKIEKKIKSALVNKSILKPQSKVTAKAKQVTKAPPQTIETPRGPETVLQRAVLEKRIERDEQGEALIKNLIVSKLNDQNEMDYVEMGIQQLDPKYAKLDGKEIVGVTSTISMTPSYAAVSKDYIRALVEEKNEAGMSPEEVAKLVEEEKEDVDNTLKMIPPELILSPGKYEMKQRLQQLRLNSESVALLEQSIIQPEITADEAQQEPTPEAMATVMHTVETGISPDVTPDQVFNSLFKESPNENFINLSSVTPGPLQDVVIPSTIPKDIHKDAVTGEMSKLTERFNSIQPADIPNVNIFTKNMSNEEKAPEKGKNKPISFEPITDEKSLWVNADLEHLVNIIGAEPVDVLDPFDLEELEKSEELVSQMANGVEYLVEADPVQYANRVQLRGSQVPSYFPGYMVAAADFPDIVKIVKTPDEAFAIAWKSVQPKYFEEESMMSILT